VGLEQSCLSATPQDLSAPSGTRAGVDGGRGLGQVPTRRTPARRGIRLSPRTRRVTSTPAAQAESRMRVRVVVEDFVLRPPGPTAEAVPRRSAKDRRAARVVGGAVPEVAAVIDSSSSPVTIRVAIRSLLDPNGPADGQIREGRDHRDARREPVGVSSAGGDRPRRARRLPNRLSRRKDGQLGGSTRAIAQAATGTAVRPVVEGTRKTAYLFWGRACSRRRCTRALARLALHGGPWAVHLQVVDPLDVAAAVEIEGTVKSGLRRPVAQW